MVPSSQRMSNSTHETSPMSERAADVRAERRRARSLACRLALAACAAFVAQRAAAAPKCSIDQDRVGAVPPIVFTGYTPFGAGVVGSTQITYTCPNPVGTASIAISAPRVLMAGANTLTFDLYQSPYPGPVWTQQPPVNVPAVKNGSVPVYAFLAPQNAAAGTYEARLDVTIYADGVANETALLVVSAVVPDTCTIAPATLAFGPYDPIGANASSPRDAQATIQIACTRATPWSVGLNTGSFPAGATRQMANGGARLQYGLYLDAARSSPWDTTSTVSGSAASTAPVNLVVHGRIPGGQSVPAGSYADAVVSTINF
jgi:spore coat protein U-like protein